MFLVKGYYDFAYCSLLHTCSKNLVRSATISEDNSSSKNCNGELSAFSVIGGVIMVNFSKLLGWKESSQFIFANAWYFLQYKQFEVRKYFKTQIGNIVGAK